MRRNFTVIGLAVAVTVSVCLGDAREDSQRNTFPVAHASQDAPGSKEFERARESMDDIIRSKSYSVDSEEKVAALVELRAQFDVMSKQYAGGQVGLYAGRRRIMADWALGNVGGQETVDALLRVAEKTDDSSDYGMTVGTAMVVAERDGFLTTGRELFDSLDPVTNPQFGWYAAETLRYLSEDAVSLTPGEGDRLSGSAVPADRKKKAEFGVFLAESYIPKMVAAVGASEGKSEVERANIAVSLQHAAKQAHYVLGPRIYPELSKLSSDIILPAILDTWEGIVQELGDNPLVSAEAEMKRIELYRNNYIPRIRELQMRYELVKSGQFSLLAPPDSSTNTVVLRTGDDMAVAPGLGLAEAVKEARLLKSPDMDRGPASMDSDSEAPRKDEPEYLAESLPSAPNGPSVVVITLGVIVFVLLLACILLICQGKRWRSR
jgi:hypothetical protein